ncbi:PfkB family carbohydrate kinase [Agrococcus terreus]|uniref:Ribokinase n=1 Tax=Agrococcus terreus TaxID=574649 RepID=A0ABQ2KKQ2_9MICO|nr:PfkB family carbohydrate kinase [Agrococcus terreus]GGN85727.1 ribokinase [Agrococcus terreus]
MSRILVVGSINADDALRVERLPGPGETVSARSAETALGGKGANQAIAAARAGAEVRMVGAVGAADGAWLVGALAADGVDASGVVALPGERSGRATVLIDDAGENSIVIAAGANAHVPLDAVDAACAALRPGDALLLQHEVPAAVSRRAASAARAAGAAVVWNAAPAPTRRDELVPDVDLLVVNEHELAAVAVLLGVGGAETAGAKAMDAEAPDAVDLACIDGLVAAVASAADADVVCTLGAAGAAYRIGGTAGRAPTRAVPAVDTTAAGDTFVGYLAALGDRPFDERLRAALAAGTLAVTRPGAAASIPHLAEVERSLEPATLGRSTP